MTNSVTCYRIQIRGSSRLDLPVGSTTAPPDSSASVHVIMTPRSGDGRQRILSSSPENRQISITNLSCHVSLDGKGENRQTDFEFKATTGHGAQGAGKR